MVLKRLSNYIGIFAVFMILAASSSAFAAEEMETLTYDLSGESLLFYKIRSLRLVISVNCRGQEFSNAAFDLSQLSCKAYQVIKNKPETNVEILGGQNPGSIACEQVGGVVVFAKDRGNSLTLCRFDDGSYAASGTLAYYFFTQRREINSAKKPNKPVLKKQKKAVKGK